MFTGKCVLFYFIIIHVRMFLVCMSLHCVHVWCPQKPKVDMRYPVHSCRLPCRAQSSERVTIAVSY